jgi:PIN domain nuclease of toxin-antitoxin system
MVRRVTATEIYATAIEHGLRLVTKDQKLRRHRHPRPVTLW